MGEDRFGNRMTRIFHLANFNSTNVGNGALISGTERVVREDFGRDEVQFVPEPWDDYNFGKKFDNALIERIHRVSDVFLVGGAVAINGRDYLSTSGWRLEFSPEQLLRIQVPIVVAGISYRFWEGQTFHHRERLAESVDCLLSRDRTWFGVRNDGTKPWLERLLGKALPGVHVMPDPALFLPTRNAEHPELSESLPNLILSLNSEDSEWRFSGDQGVRTKRRMLEAIVGALVRVHDEVQPFNLILCPHYLDDYRMIGEFISLIPPRIAHRFTVASGMVRAEKSQTFYDLYRKASVAVSMRVHSMSPSIGLATPMVPVVSQGRMQDFLNDLGLEAIGVRSDDDSLEQLLVDGITRNLTSPDQTRRAFQQATRSCRQRIREMTETVRGFAGLACEIEPRNEDLAGKNSIET